MEVIEVDQLEDTNNERLSWAMPHSGLKPKNEIDPKAEDDSCFYFVIFSSLLAFLALAEFWRIRHFFFTFSTLMVFWHYLPFWNFLYFPFFLFFLFYILVCLPFFLFFFHFLCFGIFGIFYIIDIFFQHFETVKVCENESKVVKGLQKGVKHSLKEVFGG